MRVNHDTEVCARIRPTHPYNYVPMVPNRATASDDRAAQAYSGDCSDPRRVLHTIFEGTSEIQRLIIARAISGIHIQ
ncbi:MAG TPA: hypothetical protein VMR97_00300 [Acidimicrobiales bacterium]|nr:hypothetical protein [Acidimicrobiales bacterium]